MRIRNTIKYIFKLIIVGTLVAPTISISGEVDCLANAIHHEARGESYLGKVAVAHTIINRVHSHRYPNTICRVVNQSGQFTGYRLYSVIPQETRNIANKVLSGSSVDPTNGALYFHVYTGRGRGTIIGNHIFYRNSK